MQNSEKALRDVSNNTPADVADYLERIPEASAREFLQRLTPVEIASITAELETDKAGELLHEFDIEKLVTTLLLLPPNRIADILPSLPAPTRESLLTRFPADLTEAVQSLLRYPADSAGGIMDSRVIKVRSDETVSEALERLRAGQGQRSGDVTYIYVVDLSEKLIGVVSLR